MLSSLALAVDVASAYVAAIHVYTPPDIAAKDRNHPLVVRFRMRRVCMLCVFLVAVLPLVLTRVVPSYPDCWTVWRQLGLVPGFTNTRSLATDLANVARSLAKICVLYMGPIAQWAATSPSWKHDLEDNFFTLHGFRDHVFAPVTEELVYRAAVVAVLAPVVDLRGIVFLSPLLFGLAHAHHGYQLYYRDGYSAGDVAVQVLFQLVYTSVFGALANTFYVRTGCNLWCPVVVHGMCNLLGFPSFDLKDSHPRWFCVYCFLLAAGANLFWHLL